jgi:hexokinase
MPCSAAACLQVQSICRLVLRRSARLATSLLVAVLRLQDWLLAPRRLVVAVDGGVFLKCTNWRKYLTHYLAEAFGEEQRTAVMGLCCCLGKSG